MSSSLSLKGNWTDSARCHSFWIRFISDRCEEWSLKSVEKELVPKGLLRGFGAGIETGRAQAEGEETKKGGKSQVAKTETVCLPVQHGSRVFLDLG